MCLNGGEIWEQWGIHRLGEGKSTMGGDNQEWGEKVVINYVKVFSIFL